MEAKFKVLEHLGKSIEQTRLLNRQHYELLTEYWKLLIERQENTQEMFDYLNAKVRKTEMLGSVLETEAMLVARRKEKISKAASFVNQ